MNLSGDLIVRCRFFKSCSRTEFKEKSYRFVACVLLTNVSIMLSCNRGWFRSYHKISKSGPTIFESGTVTVSPVLVLHRIEGLKSESFWRDRPAKNCKSAFPRFIAKNRLSRRVVRVLTSEFGVFTGSRSGVCDLLLKC